LATEGFGDILEEETVGYFMSNVTLEFNSEIQLSDRQFQQLCHLNRNLKFERNAQGDLIIMPPTGGNTGNRNAGLTAKLWLWNEKTKLGVAFDSSTGFKLPNGADRSPDAAWVRLDRWNALSLDQQDKFIPLCPDFVVELMSPSDQRSNLQSKMQEYQDNGVRLGILIDRPAKQVEIYRIGKAVEIYDRPETISGEEVLPEFVLQMSSIW
jgi:Uma2 family endonuclease